MKKLIGWALFYLAVALGLSCVDVSYEWYTPVYNTLAKTRVDWFATAGLSSGTLGFDSHNIAHSSMGWQYAVHAPHFSLLPIHAGGNMEGGSVFISAWLAAFGAYLVHLSWLAGAGALRRQRVAQ